MLAERYGVTARAIRGQQLAQLAAMTPLARKVIFSTARWERDNPGWRVRMLARYRASRGRSVEPDAVLAARARRRSAA